MFRGKSYWALILGGSSGFGLATAKELAAAGMNLFLVHRDRRGRLPEIEAEFAKLKEHDIAVEAFNVNALSEEGRTQVLTTIADKIGDGKIRLVLHSIALGNLKPLATDDGSPNLREDDFQTTIYNMGTSLVGWVDGVRRRGLFAADARVIGLTSEGNQIAWRGYAAVSAAKCALEAVVRSMARELAPYGIRANILQPGVTDTPALRLIPGAEAMMAHARERNPFGRLTEPQDVARVIKLLASDEAAWINGALLRVDGGEAISG